MRSSNIQIPVFLINLDRSPHRLAQMDRRLKSLNISYERFPAVDGQRLTSDSIELIYPKKKRSGRHFTRGEIGCFLSHVQVLRKIVADEIPRACILEDDVEFDRDFPLRLQAGNREVDHIPILKIETSLLPAKVRGLALGKLHGRSLAFVDRRGECGTAGYIVTAAGAKMLLKTLTLMELPIDLQMFSYHRAGFHAVHVLPPVVKQLGVSEMDRTSSSRRNAIVLWRNKAAKAYFYARKVYYQISRFGIRFFQKQDLLAS